VFGIRVCETLILALSSRAFPLDACRCLLRGSVRGDFDSRGFAAMPLGDLHVV